MRQYILMNYGNLSNLCSGNVNEAKLIEKPDWEGDWPARYFTGNTEFVFADSLDPCDSLYILGHQIYYTYSLCPQGGYFTLYQMPGISTDAIKNAKITLRQRQDVVSLKVVKIKAIIN
jgi:hypothetical protein